MWSLMVKTWSVPTKAILQSIADKSNPNTLYKFSTNYSINSQHCGVWRIFYKLLHLKAIGDYINYSQNFVVLNLLSLTGLKLEIHKIQITAETSDIQNPNKLKAQVAAVRHKSSTRIELSVHNPINKRIAGQKIVRKNVPDPSSPLFSHPAR